MTRPNRLVLSAALLSAGILLSACTFTPQQDADVVVGEAQGPNELESLEVVERAVSDGSHVLLRAEMTGTEPVSTTVFRQVIADGLGEVAGEPMLVELMFLHDDEFVSAQDATDELAPGVWFNSGGPILTGKKAKAIAAG